MNRRRKWLHCLLNLIETRLESLKDYIDELEVNYNDLSEIYQKGSNISGKSQSELLQQIPNHYAFKKAYQEAEDTKLFPKLFKLRKYFLDLLQNDIATSVIASRLFYNLYNIPNFGQDRVKYHLIYQFQKIEYVIEEDSKEPPPEIHLVGANVKGLLSKEFFILLREININGDLIFKNEIDDSEQYKAKITSFMQKKFEQIISPISFEVADNFQYIAYYIITKLYRLVAPSDDFKSLQQIIEINGKKFSPRSRNSSWNRQIKPRINKTVADSVFIDVATQLDGVIRSIHP